MNSHKFQAAYGYQGNALALPVTDLDAAREWYCQRFGMTVVEEGANEGESVQLERDGVRIGFAVNGGDPEQDGAAILVSGIEELRGEFKSRGLKIGDWRIDERDGKRFQVFFVVAPDGLCYYFHEELPAE